MLKAVLLVFAFNIVAFGQSSPLRKDFPVGERPQVTIKNAVGRVQVIADEANDKTVSFTATGDKPISEKTITSEASSERIAITVNELPSNRSRVDLIVRVPVRTRVRITSESGEISVGGNLESIEATTDSGTIYADVPLDAVKYEFLWTGSRPRYLSEVDLAEIKEKSAGKFTLSGKLGELADNKEDKEEKRNKENAKQDEVENDSGNDNSALPEDKEQEANEKNQKPKSKDRLLKETTVRLNFATRRGVILLNMPPDSVPSDLRERQLTEAAKAVVRSGDNFLTRTIRLISPKHFGDYASTLPARRNLPTLVAANNARQNFANSPVRTVTASVTNGTGRAVSDLTPADFKVYEAAAECEIISVEPADAPFNLVLLLDVSGSVDERIDFIRKSARQFVNTVSRQDQLSIITFNEDAKVLSGFTVNKTKLSESLDTFDAGGGTALYDALAFSLVETLRPLRGQRTAIVILSDGDDNRSFIPFSAVVSVIEESGALIYPIYVPSGLTPEANVVRADSTVDPLRSRFLTVTTRAETEAQQLARTSGGVYYPIKRYEDLGRAYEAIVAQLRTAYSITYRSNATNSSNANRAIPAPRPRVVVKRSGTLVNTSSAVKAAN